MSGAQFRTAGGVASEARSLISGEPAPLRLDAAGALVVTAAPPSPEVVSSSRASYFREAADLEEVAKASAGVLIGCDLVNEHASDGGYLQIFNLAAAPTLGAVPIFSWWVPAEAGSMVRDSVFFGGGYACGTGIAIGWSSTRATFTAAPFTGTAHIIFT